jgi:hypothetical protein
VQLETTEASKPQTIVHTTVEQRQANQVVRKTGAAMHNTYSAPSGGTNRGNATATDLGDHIGWDGDSGALNLDDPFTVSEAMASCTRVKSTVKPK